MLIIRAFTLINIVDSFCGAVQKNRNNFEPTENNPEDESVAADADEHGDAEEDGPDPLHQPSPGISWPGHHCAVLIWTHQVPATETITTWRLKKEQMQSQLIREEKEFSSSLLKLT